MRTISLTVLALALAGCSQQSAPAGLSGHWSALGQAELTLDLQQVGPELSGQATVPGKGSSVTPVGQFAVRGTVSAPGDKASMKLWQAGVLAYTLDCQQAAGQWNCVLSTIPVTEMGGTTVSSSVRVSSFALVR